MTASVCCLPAPSTHWRNARALANTLSDTVWPHELRNHSSFSYKIKWVALPPFSTVGCSHTFHHGVIAIAAKPVTFPLGCGDTSLLTAYLSRRRWLIPSAQAISTVSAAAHTPHMLVLLPLDSIASAPPRTMAPSTASSRARAYAIRAACPAPLAHPLGGSLTPGGSSL